MPTKPCGARVGQTGNEVFAAHARIDENAYHPGFEEREHDGDELNARRHQQRQPRPRDDAGRVQSAREPIAELIQFRKSDLLIISPPIGQTPARECDCRGVGTQASHG